MTGDMECHRFLSPLKSKPRRHADGTPVGTLSWDSSGLCIVQIDIFTRVAYERDVFAIV